MKQYLGIKTLQMLGASLPTFSGVYHKGVTEGKFAMYIVVIIGAVVYGFKREIGKAFGVLLGAGSLVFVITNLDMVMGWLTALGKLLGGQ